MTTFAGTRAHLLFERNLMVYRRSWLIIFSGLFEPLFYLASIGFGLGHFVGRVNGVSYASYIAPALLASSAMNGAIYDATTNVFWKLRYAKVYDAVLATPLGPTDVALGETSWAQFRGLLYAAGFVVTAASLGLIHSWWGLLALPSAVIVGFAFAGMGIAASTFIRSWQDFDLVQLVQLPMFLFSATFYPLSVYPDRDPVDRALFAALQRDRPRALVHARHRRTDEPRQRRIPHRTRCIRDLACTPPHGGPAADLKDAGWAIVDSNHGPPPYQSGALTN